VSAAPYTVLVHILDKEYQVACPPEREPELLAAARYLDRQMRTVRDGGKVVGLERIAVMVALNLTSELLKLREGGTDSAATNEQVKRLGERVDEALERFRQLEID
jgi:cell division protein ZapA